MLSSYSETCVLQPHGLFLCFQDVWTQLWEPYKFLEHSDIYSEVLILTLSTFIAL